MAWGKTEEVTFVIKKHFGNLSGAEGGWQKEVNLVSWNGKPEKLDIRDWNPDHTKMGKGITFTEDEARKLLSILKEVLV